MKQSKFLKTAILALLLLWSTANAQDPRKGEQPTKAVKEIPELQEWWKMPDSFEKVGRKISFLPNFHNGRNAMAVSTSDGVYTWLNRFPGDTENVFTWQYTNSYVNSYADKIWYGDFNGDGIRDYVTPGGFVYQGLENGQPPLKTPEAQYPLIDIAGVYDLNNDGYDDVIASDYPNYFGIVATIVYGGKDLKNLIVDTITRTTAPFNQFRSVASIYRTPSGEMRFVVSFYQEDYQDGFELYRVTWKQGETTPVFEKLDEIKQELQYDSGRYYSHGVYTLYKSKHHDKTFFFAAEKLDKANTQHKTHILDITNDRFVDVLSFQHQYSVPVMLEHSIDGDEYEDWYIPQNQYEKWFYSGGLTLDSIPRLKVTERLGTPISIGDVSGDGISDVALAGNGYTFAIVKGVFMKPDDITTDKEPTGFSFGEVQPHPVKVSGNALIPVNISKATYYTLSVYSLEGQHIADIFKGQLDTGQHRIPFTPAFLNITPGSYLLRLSNQTESREQTIIITN